jgi:hypothetical protein
MMRRWVTGLVQWLLNTSTLAQLMPCKVGASKLLIRTATASCQSFLWILDDATGWALTHFEPVRAWSAAEDLTPTERSEGFSDDINVSLWMQLQQAKDSDLGPIGDPAVRGSSLWLAHSLMASYHEERVRPRHRHGLRRLPRGAQGWPRECRLGLRRIFDPDGSISLVSARQEYRTAHKSLTASFEIIDLISTGERQPHHCLTLRVLFARRLNRNVRTHRGSGSGGIGLLLPIIEKAHEEVSL